MVPVKHNIFCHNLPPVLGPPISIDFFLGLAIIDNCTILISFLLDSVSVFRLGLVQVTEMDRAIIGPLA